MNLQDQNKTKWILSLNVLFIEKMQEIFVKPNINWASHRLVHMLKAIKDLPFSMFMISN